MAKKDNAVIGLLAIVGVIFFVISKVFELVMENIVIIGIFVVSICIVIILKYYIQYQAEKKQNMRNIINSIIKGNNEKYKHYINHIDESKKKILLNLEIIDQNLKYLEIRLNNKSIDSYDPVEVIYTLKNILKNESSINDEIWDLLYNHLNFNYINHEIEFDQRIKALDIIEKPEYFELKKNTNDKKNNQLVNKIEQAKVEYNQNIKSLYDSISVEINKRIDLLSEKHEKIEKRWTSEFEIFENQKEQKNNEVDILKSSYFNNDKNTITTYYSKLLEEIIYDPNFHKSVIVDYKNEVLIIEYLLPSIEQFPNIKEIRYIKTRNEFKEINFSQREFNNLYDDIIYRIVLDLISISFKNDIVDSIKSIVFNGWSNAINKATGLYNKACILSVVCDKNEFLKINLSEVEPKECFKSLKGISANKIRNLIPIKPIISIDNNDKRFVSSQEVGIDSSTNLASMHWEDFEHLIREIFEQEFSLNGGEVKVTQSSRDGGVDAIAFDPDPIRGGKIVIQAKRYTNIVGVSAVRDLYGTIMNEGATKGILVTTSDYGSDSFKFAKDKPITLINGGNLLYLLEKHGYKARINIKEAKDEFKLKY